ncbi:hypothetical protein BJV82DRAFT_617870 [Fennellomyces sp. T-0311]|nr:hypothetical protein BJV82DRAFT_617870 [Fennellomyces sp. T-0311]
MLPVTRSALYGPLYDRDSCHHCCCCCCCCCCCTAEAYPSCYPPQTTVCCDSAFAQHPLDPLSCCTVTEERASLASTNDTSPPPDRPPTSSSIGDEDEYRLQKQALRRNHAINELMQTERDYVTDLGRLVEVYFDTLNRQDWILVQHKQTILRNASDLLSFHRLFLSALENNPNDGEHIARAFLDLGQHFMLYTSYCDSHDEAWSLCEEYRDRPEWSQFVKECMALIAESATPSSVISITDQPIGKQLQFEDYLIKPVQRICRYQLLLKEIIRYTPTDSSAYDTLTEAVNLVQETVTDIDRLKNDKDIRKRTERFVQRLDGDWRITKRHVSKLGNLLISGAIEVTYTALGQSVAKPRYLGCFVFPTYIILVRPKKVTAYEPKHWFPLRLAELEDLCDIEGQRENSFIVRCRKHTFAFNATCHQEKQLWIKHLSEAIDNIMNGQETVHMEELIVPSLSGISAKKAAQQREPNVRLSRSFTNMLDMKLGSNCGTTPPIKLKRSVSTSVQLDDIITESPPPPAPLQKRYSADYPATRRKELLKARTNSENYMVSRKRPGSLDLLSTSNGPTNVIGKVSMQIRSNHQNALRMAVDHKLHAVCTQDYLSSRATWYLRDVVDLRKRKSMPFIRSSASSFSIMSPARRTSEQPTNNDFEIQSTISSTTSSAAIAAATTAAITTDNDFRRTEVKEPLTIDTSTRIRMTPTTTTPISIFSGMDRSISTLSMQPFKKSALVDRMFNKLTNLSRKSTRRKVYLEDEQDDAGSHYTGEDYNSDVNSYNASEVTQKNAERERSKTWCFRSMLHVKIQCLIPRFDGIDPPPLTRVMQGAAIKDRYFAGSVVKVVSAQGGPMLTIKN